MSYWRGKRAVITGGSTGLGLAVATELARRGSRLIIAARREAQLDAAAEKLRGVAAEIISVSADVTKPADVERLAATAMSAWGDVDLLCHCAGRSMRGEVLTTTADDFLDLWETNFLSAVRCVQAFASSLTNNRGHLVLIGSLASKAAARYLGAYPASKFPLAAYAQQLRLENEPGGFHTLLVCPGPIKRASESSDGFQSRYVEQASGLPSAAQQPGGGAKVRASDPNALAVKILQACEQRRAELVVPNKARLLFAAAQLSPRLGDWLLRKMTSG
ncbi:MAG TPA: SDR family NAD(P)-dependent oxidoreductase [Lacipirellulaceae bacterium]|jgi:short-subunit dehydrogenase|nr:SDR family NAD(P)-dependent oxidoreductase [Lacipirellulaceae bacterium]